VIPIEAALAIAAPGVEAPYVLETRMASEARVPVIGRTRSTTVSRAVATIQQVDGRLVLTQQVCDVVVEGGGLMATTRVPPAFVAALPVTSHVVELAPGDEDGWSVRVDLGVSVIGWLPPSKGAPLPTTADDPSVRDTDGDGRPGATVELKVHGVGTFGIEVVQRAHAVLEGQLGMSSIAGGVRTLLLEQHVIGADHRLLRSSPSVSPDDARSSFTLTRVTPGTTCATLEEGGS
jgi:hypothetical protein